MHNTDPVQLELIKLYNIKRKGKALGRFVRLTAHKMSCCNSLT